MEWQLSLLVDLSPKVLLCCGTLVRVSLCKQGVVEEGDNHELYQELGGILSQIRPDFAHVVSLNVFFCRDTLQEHIARYKVN